VAQANKAVKKLEKNPQVTTELEVSLEFMHRHQATATHLDWE
jgi:hypothetical protein